MAKQAAKKLVDQNKTALKIIDYGLLISILVYIIVRVGVRFRTIHWIPVTVFAISTLACVYLRQNLRRIAVPVYKDNKLIYPGRAIQAGLNEYKFDIVLVLCFVATIASLCDWLWLGAAIIPGYAIIKIWTKFIAPWIFAEGAKEATEEDTKEQERAQRRRERKRMKRMR